MTQICIIPPSSLAVPIEQARANMRIDGTDMDQFLTLWLEGITAAAEHEIGQCLMRQTWEVHLDSFPASIPLPHPVLDVKSVVYVDPEGLKQQLAAEAYQLVPGQYASSLVPARGTEWPKLSAGPGALVVTVASGYGDDPKKVPANVRLYLLAKLVDQFDPNTRTERETAPSPFIARLLDACRSRI